MLAVALLTGADYDKRGASGVSAASAFPAVRKLLASQRQVGKCVCPLSGKTVWIQCGKGSGSRLHLGMCITLAVSARCRSGPHDAMLKHRRVCRETSRKCRMCTCVIISRT